MLNQCTFMGRLTRDPELRQVGETPCCNFSIACERDYLNADKERETDFIDVVCWRKTAEFTSTYFRKGQLALVSGRLQVRNYTDKEGNKRRAVELNADRVYFCESKKSRENSENSVNEQQPPAAASADDFDLDLLDDTPF